MYHGSHAVHEKSVPSYNRGVTLDLQQARDAREMLAYTQEYSPDKTRYIPYYMYRQSRMVGNLENVGWSKEALKACTMFMLWTKPTQSLPAVRAVLQN